MKTCVCDEKAIPVSDNMGGVKRKRMGKPGFIFWLAPVRKWFHVKVPKRRANPTILAVTYAH